MENSATGLAESASMRTTVSGGPASRTPLADSAAPSPIAHGSGLDSAPRSARSAAARAPGPAAPGPPAPSTPGACSSCDKPMHSELVTNRSASTVQITGPAAAGPSSATSSGTPMKPVLGNAATSAPNAASFNPTRALRDTRIVKNTTTSAHSPYTASSVGLSSSSTGVLLPKRSSRQGSAKYST